MEIKYTPLHNHHYLEYFTDDEIPIPKEYLIKIKPLEENSSGYFWDTNISSRNKHPMRLDDSDWFSSLNLQALCQWQSAWNKNEYSRIKSTLRNQVSWEDNTVVYMCWHRSVIIETTWEIFSEYWINFLFEDEGPILIAKGKNEIFTFGPSDNIFYAKRSND
jgi:hypothetical protein